MTVHYMSCHTYVYNIFFIQMYDPTIAKLVRACYGIIFSVGIVMNVLLVSYILPNSHVIHPSQAGYIQPWWDRYDPLVC